MIHLLSIVVRVEAKIFFEAREPSLNARAATEWNDVERIQRGHVATKSLSALAQRLLDFNQRPGVGMPVFKTVDRSTDEIRKYLTGSEKSFRI